MSRPSLIIAATFVALIGLTVAGLSSMRSAPDAPGAEPTRVAPAAAPSDVVAPGPAPVSPPGPAPAVALGEWLDRDPPPPDPDLESGFRPRGAKADPGPWRLFDEDELMSDPLYALTQEPVGRDRIMDAFGPDTYSLAYGSGGLGLGSPGSSGHGFVGGDGRGRIDIGRLRAKPPIGVKASERDKPIKARLAGPPQTRGSCPPGLGRSLRRRLSALRACVVAGPRDMNPIVQALPLRWQIGADGRVSTVKSSGPVNQRIQSCARRVIRRIRFAATGGPCQVTQQVEVAW